MHIELFPGRSDAALSFKYAHCDRLGGRVTPLTVLFQVEVQLVFLADAGEIVQVVEKLLVPCLPRCVGNCPLPYLLIAASSERPTPVAGKAFLSPSDDDRT
mgnify:CR=1 FL=1